MIFSYPNPINFKPFQFYVSCLIVAVLTTSCGSSKYTLKPNTRIEKLSICMDFHETVSKSTQEEYTQCVQAVIGEFNRESHLFKLDTCTNFASSAFRLKIRPFRYVEKNTQVVAGVLNIIGVIGVPIILLAVNSPVICGMYVPLMNKSTISHKLTKDLTTNPDTHEKKLANSANLIGKERQRELHQELIRKFLRKELIKIERAQSRLLRREGNKSLE